MRWSSRQIKFFKIFFLPFLDTAPVNIRNCYHIFQNSKTLSCWLKKSKHITLCFHILFVQFRAPARKVIDFRLNHARAQKIKQCSEKAMEAVSAGRRLAVVIVYVHPLYPQYRHLYGKYSEKYFPITNFRAT